MDLSKVKVGDGVCSCLRGWGEVFEKTEHHFFVKFEHTRKVFKFDGKYYSTDINPEIIDWEPKKREWGPQLHLVKPHGMETIRACKTLSAYVAEFAPDWKADWSDVTQSKHSVVYCLYENKWLVQSHLHLSSPEIVCMPQEIAYQLCEDLSNGVVEL